MANEELKSTPPLLERIRDVFVIKARPLNLPESSDVDEDGPFPLKPGRTIKGL